MSRQPHRAYYLHGWGFSNVVFSLLDEQLITNNNCPCLYKLAGQSQTTLYAAIAKNLASLLTDNAILIGWSMGGQIAIEVAALTAKVKGLILIASTPLMVNKKRWAYSIPRERFTSLKQGFKTKHERIIKKLAALAAHGESEQRHVVNSLLRFPAPLKYHAVLDELLGEMANKDVRDSLSALKIPVIFLLGEKDALINSNFVKTIDNKNIRCRIIRAAGHAPFINYPGTIRSEIEVFLSGLHDYNA